MSTADYKDKDLPILFSPAVLRIHKEAKSKEQGEEVPVTMLLSVLYPI